jgi:hypothetical protein
MDFRKTLQGERNFCQGNKTPASELLGYAVTPRDKLWQLRKTQVNFWYNLKDKRNQEVDG